MEARSLPPASEIGRGRLLEAAVRLVLDRPGSEEAEEAVRYLTEHGPASRHLSVCPLPVDDERLEDNFVRIQVHGALHRCEALVVWDAPPEPWLGLAALILGRFMRNLLVHDAGREFFGQPVGSVPEFAERQALEQLGRRAHAEAHVFAFNFLIDGSSCPSSKARGFAAEARRRLGIGAFGLTCLDWCLEQRIVPSPSETFRVQAAQLLGRIFAPVAEGSLREENERALLFAD